MSSERSERNRWQELGRREPYWAVCTDPRFRARNLSERDREDFFASGEREVAATFERIASLVGKPFRPNVALDYGCGVGRLVLPIARRSEQAIGVDISDAMLGEARANAQRQQLENVVLQRPEDALSVQGPDLEFIHSFIVFQHIEPAIGLDITRALLRRLVPGGVGSLHYAFRRKASVARRLSHTLRRRIPGFNALVNAVQGKPLSEPMIPLYEYDRDQLLRELRENGCRILQEHATDHGGLLGSVLIFQKAG